MNPSFRLRLAALVLGLGLVAAACGDSDEPAGEDTIAPTTTAAEAPATTTTAAPSSGEETRVAQEGDTVSVHYVGTLDDGEQFDASRDRGEPLTFVVGAGQMIAGFDAAVRGMAVGETKTVRLEPGEAYGERSDEALIDVPIGQVPEGTSVGDQLFSSTGQTVTVVAVSADTVTIDANHPLAGESLTFEIEMVSIQ
jgi:FKBP-type peptidyl-prolyl cis-trans isomerase 2